VGSLLRHEELLYLSHHGRLVPVFISASNRVRHERTRTRGRDCERVASERELVILDAHRGGEWPGYETNDLGGLVSQERFTVGNNEEDPLETVADDILKYVKGVQKGG